MWALYVATLLKIDNFSFFAYEILLMWLYLKNIENMGFTPKGSADHNDEEPMAKAVVSLQEPLEPIYSH